MGYLDATKQRDYQRNWMARRRSEFFADKSCVRCGATERLESRETTSSAEAMAQARNRGVDTMMVEPRRLLTPERIAASSATEITRSALRTIKDLNSK